MLAHSLAVRPRELRPERTDTLVELLNLGFTQDRPCWLVLQAVHQGGEQVDVLSLHWSQFVIVLLCDVVRWRGTTRAPRGLLFECHGVLLLLLFHIRQRRSDRSFELCVVLLLGNLWHDRPRVTGVVRPVPL